MRETAEAATVRAVAHAREGDRERAKQILDDVLDRDPRALYAFLGRRSLAIEDGELEPAAVFDELPAIIATNVGARTDPDVARFAARLAEHVVELDSDLHPRELLFSPDGTHVLVRGAGGLVLVEVTGANIVARRRDDTLVAAAFASDDTLIVAAAHRWQRLSLPALAVVDERPFDGGRLLAVRADGDVLAMTAGGELAFTETGSWRTLGIPQCRDAGRFSRDGRFAATLGGGGTNVELWDLASASRLEFSWLPVGGRFRNVFEHARVDLGRLVNNLPHEARDRADATLLPDGVHVATAGPGGVAIWSLGIAPAVSTLVRIVWPWPSTHVEVAADRLAAIVQSPRSGTTLRFAGTLAPRPVTQPWPLVTHRPLEPAVVEERRQLAEVLLEVVEAGEVASARELAELQAATPSLRDDIALARRLHRATLPFGLPVAATARFARGFPVQRGGTALLDAAGERLFVGLEGRVAVYDLASGELRAELAIGARQLAAIGAGDRLLLLSQSLGTGDLFTRYDQIASIVDIATGTLHELGRCTAAAVHPERDLVVLDHQGTLGIHDGRGAHRRDFPIRGSLPRFLGEGSLLRLVHDHEVRIYRFDEPLVVLGAARFELRMGGRPDPRVSADGRYLLERDREQVVLVRTSDGGRHLERAPSSVSARRFATWPDAPELDLGPRIHDRADGLVALVRGERAEVWIVDHTCELVEDVVDELAAVITGKHSDRWPSHGEPFAQLDGWLDRWDDLTRLSARPRFADLDGRAAMLRATIIEQLLALPLDRAIVARRAALVDRALAERLVATNEPSPPQLRISTGDMVTMVPLSRTEPNTLGRHFDNTIQVLERTLGQEHCIIRWDGARWLVRDLGGMAGTWLGSERITGERAVEVGQPITMGSVTVVIE